MYLEEASNTLINIQKELKRALKLSCNLCGKKGAACGCFQKGCKKNFHIACMLEE